MSVRAGETQGRVQSIKSKFENLNSFESLDISTTAATTTALANNHQWKSSPKFLFKRSLTTIDFRSKYNNNDNNNNNNNTINTGNRMDSKNNIKLSTMTTKATKTSTSPANHDGIHKSSYLRRHNILDRTVSADTYSIRKRTNNNQTSAEDTLKPLKELKENVEVRLTRHTNDPIKRSSIKRSPAFRVGAIDKCNNSNINGNASKTNEKTELIADKGPKVPKQLQMPNEPKVPKEFANKMNEVLKRCDNDKLNEPGLTDTLKAFLRQPLPDGPAPKKPPRTFQKNNNRPETPNEIRQKIDLLENQLVFKQTKKTPTTTTPSPSTQKTKSWRSAKDKSSNSNSNSTTSSSPFGSSLLNCIVPCTSAAIYDTMIVDHKSPIKMISTAIKEANVQNSKQTILLTNKSQLTTQQRRLPNGIRKSPAEHIYMEPFAHLKSNNNVVKCNGTTTSTLSSSSSSSASASPTQIATTITTSTMHNDSHNQCENHSGSLTLSNQTNNDANNGSVDGDSLGSSLVSCTSCMADDHSLTDLHDIHYMCTSIENKIKSSDSDSNSNEIDQSTLKTTYDEINSFVNAAFDQHIVSDKMGNTMDTYELSAASISNSNALTSPSSNASIEAVKTVKLCRTLTEKRKDYVRRVSNVRNIPETILRKDSSMHQTFKPAVFRTFSVDNTDNTDQNGDSPLNGNNSPKHSDDEKLVSSAGDRTDAMAVDDVDGCIVQDTTHSENDQNENENATKLFQVCLLIGYNSSTRQAYIKSKFPIDEDVPPNIEQLVFPSPNLLTQTQANQDYSIVLTDNDGYHVYGYCRRILPEGCQICLPLAYCLISEVKAPGFYFKILREIETRHGQAEFQTNFLLQNLQNRSIPEAGKLLHLKLPLSPKPKIISTSYHKIHATPKRLSLEVNPKWLTESAAQAAFNNNDIGTNDTQPAKKEHRSSSKSLVQEFEEKKLNNANGAAPFDLSLINRSLLNGRGNKCDEIVIQRPNDLRLESTELSDLYKALGPDLLIVVFSSLLLERKVILYTENISILSSCVLGLQTLLYPFEWQHALITILPQTLAEICQAPIPVLAGMLEPITFDIEDGIVIDLNTRTLVQKCGDETTILPSSLIKSLKVSLEMVDLLHHGKMLSSVLTAEAFLRCFVELFRGFNSKYFHKKLFIESHPSQSYRLFLEWFVETAMFRHFIQKRFPTKQNASSDDDPVAETDTKFYDLFDSRIYKSNNEAAGTQQGIEAYTKNFHDINKKTKTFKDRFKDLMKSTSNHNSHNNNN